MFTFPFKYDYINAMISDISCWFADANIHCNCDASEPLRLTDDNFEDIYDEMFDCDDITGNASGSYTMNRETARAMVLENIDILQDAALEFYITADLISNWLLNEDWEKFDVAIRCYLLREALTTYQCRNNRED